MENNEWKQLRDAAREAIAAENRLVRARQDFLSEQVSVDERVSVLRHEIIEGDRFTALKFLGHLSLEERKQLFPTLVWLTFSHHSDTPIALKLILSLPPSWIIDHLEDTIKHEYDEDKHAQLGDKYTAYITVMDIFKEQDYEVTVSLAKKAAESSDTEIKQASTEFLEALVDKNNP